ncbi:MAG TPA: DinB family protein [Acidobacteriaceae bacterium]|jgi:hypothetical protein
MEHQLEDTVALLARTPATLNTLLRDLPESWTRGNEGENTWSPCEIVGHLVHAERTDWLPRVKMILDFGETRTFTPYDRTGFRDQAPGTSLSQLLDQFARLRSDNLHALHVLNLQSDDLNRRGCHPSFGVVTLGQLLATWSAHDLTHLHQISRVLACQYRDAVGPWSKFLGVLRCNGHSSEP